MIYLEIISTNIAILIQSEDVVNTTNPVYSVDREQNSMSLDDLLLYIPAYHSNRNSVIPKSGIFFENGCN